jgi:hypothetical protein
LLIHQIPPKPDYLRVKIWRRLQDLGAVAIKNSVYVLPASEQTHEDFRWVQREIEKSGGEASICEARFVDGLNAEQVTASFNTARDADYASLADDARALLARTEERGALAEERRAEIESGARRLRRRFDAVTAIDFFRAAGRGTVEGLLAGIESRLAPATRPPAPGGVLLPADYRGRVWVTRRGVHIDRMACAWLIRRFIDADARFKFVGGKTYAPAAGEVRFDMFEAEFTHEGDRCTFEVLADAFVRDDAALRPLAEIIHDIDLKDGKFGRAETPGVAQIVLGIAMAEKDDEERLAQAAVLFDGLYRNFRTKRR